MTIELKDHFPKMPTHELHRLMNHHKAEVEAWEREYSLAVARNDDLAMRRMSDRVKRAKAAAKRAEISLRVRDQAWGEAS